MAFQRSQVCQTCVGEKLLWLKPVERGLPGGSRRDPGMGGPAGHGGGGGLFPVETT